MSEVATRRSMTEYKASSRQRLAMRGGKLIQVQLEAGSVAALAQMRRRLGLTTDKEAIVKALDFWIEKNC